MLAPVGPGLGPELGLPAACFCTEFFIFARFYKGFFVSRRETKKSGPSAGFCTFLLKNVPRSKAIRQNTVNVLTCVGRNEIFPPLERAGGRSPRKDPRKSGKVNMIPNVSVA